MDVVKRSWQQVNPNLGEEIGVTPGQPGHMIIYGPTTEGHSAVVICAMEGCNSYCGSFEQGDEKFVSLSRVRQQAIASGWKRAGEFNEVGRWVCPACTELVTVAYILMGVLDKPWSKEWLEPRNRKEAQGPWEGTGWRARMFRSVYKLIARLEETNGHEG